MRLLALLLLLGQAEAERPPEPGLEPRGARALAEGRYADALAIFEAQQAAEPESAAARYGRGLALQGLLDYSGAVAALESATSLDPGHAAAWRRLVALYPQVGRKEEALDAWRRARDLAEVPEEERVALGRALRKAGWLAEARALLEGPGAPAGASLELGLVAAERGDHAAAERYLRELVAPGGTAAPNGAGAEAELEYGRALEGLGRRDEAIAHYRRALGLNPHLGPARFRLGRALLRSGETGEGEALLRGYESFRQWQRRVKLLQFMVASGKLPEDEEREKTLQLVSLLLQGGAAEEAGPVIASALSRRPGDPELLTARARWELATGRAGAARETLAPVLAGAMPPPDALWLAARLELMAGDAEAAVAGFERVLERDRNPPAALLKEAATAYAVAGRPAEAEASFRRALERAPEAADVHADLGMLLESLGRTAEAETLYRRALDLDPALVAAQRALGGLLLRRGDAAEAVERLRRGVTLAPRDPGLRRELAAALEAQGRGAEADAERAAARELEARGR